MAMHLIDRPELTPGDIGHRGLSGLASAALHAVVAATLIAALQVGSGKSIPDTAQALIPQHLIWIPHVDVGGGRASGGDQSRAVPRQARLVGHDATTIPPPEPVPSTSVTDNPPPDLAAIPARPMADAMQVLAGVIQGDSASTSLGPGTSDAGTSPGSDRGALGNRPGPDIGPGVTRGGPGVTFPIPIEQVKPQYTSEAMRARVQGSVSIECVVMPDGSVGDLRIIRSLDRQFGLDEEAIKAARRWRFRPGSLHGEPVPVVVTIELMFSVR
jgi:protein TonB